VEIKSSKAVVTENLRGTSYIFVIDIIVNKRAPVYLQNLLTTTSCVPGPTQNCSASNNDHVKQSTRLNLVNVPSPLPDSTSGISCPLTSKPSRSLVFLGTNLNLLYFR